MNRDYYNDNINRSNQINTNHHVLPMQRAESAKAAELAIAGHKCGNCFYYLSKLACGNCTLKNKTVKPYNICYLHLARVNLDL